MPTIERGGRAAPRPTSSGGRRTGHLLAQHAVLDAAAVREPLEVVVADGGVTDGAQRRHHRGDEALPSLWRAHVVTPRVVVDQVVHDALGLGDRRLPRGSVVADDLVGILALGKADDADVRDAHLGAAPPDLPDERAQLGGAEGARALPGGVHVVREGDRRGVACDELHLARRERRPEPGHHVLEALLVGH